MIFENPVCILKIDVDTFHGMKDGIPRMLSLFDELKIKASFFVAMGPDNSGKALRRIFLHRGFLEKMLRTKAGKMYGPKTLLYGTLLPAPRVGESAPEVLREIEKRGHEASIHGYDHVKWHDFLYRMNEQKTREEFMKAVNAYEKTFNRKPLSSAAPGWQLTPASLKIQNELKFTYISDTRGKFPYFPKAGDKIYDALELPTTLPTMDEVIGTDTDENMLASLISQAGKQKLCVFTAHTEVEGMSYFSQFKNFLERLLEKKFIFMTGMDCAKKLLEQREKIPSCEFYRGILPGRAGYVTIQKAG